jgi:phospholipase C
VSPLVPRNLIDHRPYDHSSIPATVERIFGLDALTARDGAANDLSALASLPTPRIDCPTKLPDPALSGGLDRRNLAFAAGVAEAAFEDQRPADTGNLPGFLGVALRLDAALDPAAQNDALARVASIQTRADATAYINDVLRKLGQRGDARVAGPVG